MQNYGVKYLFKSARALLIFGVLMNVAHAQIEIDISGGEVRGIPTAIVPFRVIEDIEIEHDIHAVVAADLAATGRFEIIDPNNFLSFPSRAEEFRVKDWRLIDAEALVMGEIWRIARDNYEVQFRIFDVAREQQIGTAKRIPNLKAEDLRTAAHIISDAVYNAFTGGGAAFDSHLAYVQRSQKGERTRYKLMVSDWDGYGATEVFASWKPILSPAWSPNGDQLAFVSYAKAGPIVQVLNLVSGRRKVIADFKGVNTAPAWSPDGNKLAYSTSRHGNPDVYVYDLTSDKHTRITQHYGIDTEPAFSLDGEHLLFTSSRSRKPQIYRYDFASGEVSRVTFNGDENANASYSPQGDTIVMVHKGGQIVVMEKETQDLKWLTKGKFDESPSFAANGDMVMYASEQGYRPVILVASADGRVRTRLSLVRGDVREPAWSALRR